MEDAHPAENTAEGSNNPPVSPQSSATPPAPVSEPHPAQLPVGHTHELAAPAPSAAPAPTPVAPPPAPEQVSVKPVSPAPAPMPPINAAPLVRETTAPSQEQKTAPILPQVSAPVEKPISIPKVIAPHPIDPSIATADAIVKPPAAVKPVVAPPQTPNVPPTPIQAPPASLIHNDMPLPEPPTPDPDAPQETSHGPFMADIGNILKGIKLPDRFSAKVTGEPKESKIPEPVILSEKIIPPEEKKTEKTTEAPATQKTPVAAMNLPPHQAPEQPKMEAMKPVQAPAAPKPVDLPSPSIPQKPEEPKEEKTAPLQAPMSGQPLISPIRTFKEDLMHIVRDRKISLVRAVALEEDKKSRIHQPSPQEIAAHRQRHRRVFAVLFTTGVLIFLGSAALFGVYTIEQKRAGLPQVIANVSMIFAEQNLSFPLQDLSASEIKRILSQSRGSSNASLGSITRIVPTLPSIDGNGKTTVRAASTQEFFKAIEATAPESLLRALGSEFFFGIHTVDKNAPLMVIPVTDYEHAFAGMLEWEKSMNTDLAPAFTAVSGFKIDENGLPQQRLFDDMVMRNYDVRTLKDDAGNIQLYYSFPTPKVLIIAESPYSFTEILTRLQASRKL